MRGIPTSAVIAVAALGLLPAVPEMDGIAPVRPTTRS
ncbi:hypothetical protein SAMN05216506_116148 [Saccharopolyspora kobensis]|uniref:Uncharacterized protein n=1 Tax=Saccharopolyspora kobensis TaxID=146035 RepID=A0ABY1E667_9PSEU|nr:hypothetical protein SAMN05216506_116148 [Saccharopolyspora kobensis]